jgi:MFS family permease
VSAVGALRRTFASARTSRNFRLFLSGQFVSAIGTWMNFTASGWLVWRLTHSGSALGINSALAFGPMLLLGAWGGVLADRFNKRKILITTQSMYAVLALVMATLIGTHVIELWMVYTLSVLTGFVTAIDNPARQSFYVEMVGEAELTNAVSLNSAAFTGARVIGPAIAGIVIAAAGMAWCFGLDAVSRAARAAAFDAGQGPSGGRHQVRLGDRRASTAVDRPGGDVHLRVPVAGVDAAAGGGHVPCRCP